MRPKCGIRPYHDHESFQCFNSPFVFIHLLLNSARPHRKRSSESIWGGRSHRGLECNSNRCIGKNKKITAIEWGISHWYMSSLAALYYIWKPGLSSLQRHKHRAASHAVTAGAGLIWWGGKMLRQVVWILPSHILPFQTVGSHDFGKILTICFQFCLPGKTIRSPQCVVYCYPYPRLDYWDLGDCSFLSLMTSTPILCYSPISRIRTCSLALKIYRWLLQIYLHRRIYWNFLLLLAVGAISSLMRSLHQGR